MSQPDPDPSFPAGVVLIGISLLGVWSLYQRDLKRTDMLTNGTVVEARVVGKGDEPLYNRSGRVNVEIPGPTPTVVPIWLPNEQWHFQPASGTIQVRWLATRPDATQPERAFQAGTFTTTQDVTVVSVLGLAGVGSLAWSLLRMRRAG